MKSRKPPASYLREHNHLTISAVNPAVAGDIPPDLQELAPTPVGDSSSKVGSFTTASSQSNPPDKRRNKWLIFLLVFFIAVTVPLVVFLAQQSQELRQRALVYASPSPGGGTGTCEHGKIYCRKNDSSICPGTNSENPAFNRMVGAYCSNGQIDTGSCSFYDACADQTTGGGTCAGRIRLSGGEPHNGGFVGCEGLFNCFCGAPFNSVNTGQAYTAADGNVRCQPDEFGDSCGAQAINPTPQPTPQLQCGSTCTSSALCPVGMICHPTLGVCRNPSCQEKTDCICGQGATPAPTPAATHPPGISPQPTPRATPPATPAATPTLICNSVCQTDNQCPTSMICNGGFCRNPQCTASSNCLCASPLPSPTPSPGIGGPNSSPTPSTTPVPYCNASCTENTQCPSTMICYIAAGQTTGACRNPA
ncbi:MAG: hypothetical protein AAB874_05725, partial [Patescibacteria group bacterium]